ncbi:unnamed protein product [Mycena citricolor]|uniref:Uncharacterized protein n=1 Tax=Mycena citricolor TaxID=2018698 RepID=A0AAD2H8F9_9AGAR|nr:unnamed protein product [Mycena citricolor]
MDLSFDEDDFLCIPLMFQSFDSFEDALKYEEIAHARHPASPRAQHVASPAVTPAHTVSPTPGAPSTSPLTSPSAVHPNTEVATISPAKTAAKLSTAAAITTTGSERRRPVHPRSQSSSSLHPSGPSLLVRVESHRTPGPAGPMMDDVGRYPMHGELHTALGTIGSDIFNAGYMSANLVVGNRGNRNRPPVVIPVLLDLGSSSTFFFNAGCKIEGGKELISLSGMNPLVNYSVDYTDNGADVSHEYEQSGLEVNFYNDEWAKYFAIRDQFFFPPLNCRDLLKDRSLTPFQAFHHWTTMHFGSAYNVSANLHGQSVHVSGALGLGPDIVKEVPHTVPKPRLPSFLEQLKRAISDCVMTVIFGEQHGAVYFGPRPMLGRSRDHPGEHLGSWFSDIPVLPGAQFWQIFGALRQVNGIDYSSLESKILFDNGCNCSYFGKAFVKAIYDAISKDCIRDERGRWPLWLIPDTVQSVDLKIKIGLGDNIDSASVFYPQILHIGTITSVLIGGQMRNFHVGAFQEKHNETDCDILGLTCLMSLQLVFKFPREDRRSVSWREKSWNSSLGMPDLMTLNPEETAFLRYGRAG